MLYIEKANARPIVPGGHPQILAAKLTLSQPGGADHAHQVILALPDFQTFLRPWMQLHKNLSSIVPYQSQTNEVNQHPKGAILTFFEISFW